MSRTERLEYLLARVWERRSRKYARLECAIIAALDEARFTEELWAARSEEDANE